MFTVEEANKLLPKIVPLVAEIQEKRETILGLEVEIDALEIIDEKNHDGFSPAFDSKVEAYNKTVNRFYAAIDEIHEIGCFLKDVDSGLIDFYSLHNGRVVYLCWKMGEAKVAFWHEIGRGFTHRQPLEIEK